MITLQKYGGSMNRVVCEIVGKVIRADEYKTITGEEYIK